MITLSSVTKRYASDVAIGPVDLEVPAGGITALIGPNGAGKSTLLTIVGRLLGMDAGAVEIAGLDVARTRSADLARVVAVLRQENHLVTRLTVRQLVGFGRFPHSRGRLTAHDEEVVSRSVDFLDLGALEGRYLDELSGGQRQRAYVAMVLAQDTEVVLLDEPLNNLDMAHSVQMMQLLRRMTTELGRTVVVVLHDVNFAGHYADHVVALKDGLVRYTGTPAEVIRAEVLTDVFDTPVDVVDGPRGRLAVYY
ncbi:ABC transporter ATP-binding protein [Cellulomonas marina]|uniref:Iron complex transport system ATP-binding protein n=1 Tax=Cellulomonas marina TaxID=988821 RepID=A0A1I0XAH5_9CELL|nr:ATP-binding cassette domain-containing protein [Cellulomonas marina]GIG29511.1 iron ABC transporter ATP-binding protein [Cellulomonas marina]SFA97288.1 iron complex transport system ATP-binding protein [Cellulomonas marina]